MRKFASVVGEEKGHVPRKKKIAREKKKKKTQTGKKEISRKHLETGQGNQGAPPWQNSGRGSAVHCGK